jgi:hypothetical protein
MLGITNGVTSNTTNTFSPFPDTHDLTISNKPSSRRHEFINSSLVTNTKQFFFKRRDNGNTAFVKQSNTNDNREVTHLLLDGGNIHLPIDEMDEFYSCYASDLVCGRKNFVVELKTPVFKYFMDLDIFDHEFYEGKRLTRLIITIQQALSFFFNRYKELTGDVYICTTPPKECRKYETDYIKTGVHLIWPDIFVTIDIAIFLRQFVVQYVTAKLGKRPINNSWDEVIDGVVYEKNGLRMIGSYKASPCNACKRNKDNFSCDTCKGLGRLYGNHVYTLHSIISTKRRLKTKLVAEIKKQQGNMIELLSIRTHKFRANIDVKEPYPPWFSVSAASKSNKHLNRILKPTRAAQQKTGGVNAINVGDTEIIETIERVLKESFQVHYPNVSEYQDIYIKSVRKPIQSKHACYWVTTECRYCLNVGREHNSSTVYFKIDYNGVVLRCFSKKTTLSDRNITCSKYHSLKHEISLRYKEILFPILYSEQKQLQEAVYKLSSNKTTHDDDDDDTVHTSKPSAIDDFLNDDEHDLFN